MNYVKNLAKVYKSVISNGSGITSLIGVEPKGTAVPINNEYYTITPSKDKGVDDLIKKVVTENAYMLDSLDYFLAAWLNKKQNLINIQICTAHTIIEEAIYVGIIRGVSELHITEGVVHPVEVDLPTPQRGGTETQKNTYAKIQAQKLYQEFQDTFGKLKI